MTHRAVSFAVFIAFMTSLAVPVYAVKKGQAKFMGGTIKSIAEKAEGPIDLTNEKRLTFFPKNSAVLEIPWDRVSQLEYGQNVARRWRSAILLSPLALFSKSRKHFITITYQDQNKAEQAVVLEFDNDDIRMVLASLKARTLQTIIMQDEEAKKELGGTIEKK
ncbi:MAG: hypothetical protein ABI672_09625 [Vicinamibacteria bacterium]